MAPSMNDGQKFECVTEIYVAVFPVPMSGETSMAETILAGYQKDTDNFGRIRVRATVETRISAVPDLVAMCDKIVAEQEALASYRLLKFDKVGIHELDPADFRESDPLPFSRYPQKIWGIC